MIQRRRTFNPKRKIRSTPDLTALARLADEVGYGGNPEHKRNPRDFGLTPPAMPRPDKTLCDEVAVTSRELATELLRQSIRRGFVSEQTRGRFPQNVWAVTEEGDPLEAQLENESKGIYHGYPMPETDPFRDQVLSRWKLHEK